MKKENRLITIVLSLIALIAMIIWAFNQSIFRFLPIGSDYPYTIFTGIISLIALLALAIGSIRTIINWIKPNDQKISKEERLLRNLGDETDPISKGRAEKEYTSKILIEKSNDFWIKIESHKNAETLSVLSKDPFILEGLIRIYKDKQGNLPQNIGALLDALLKIQWTPEKLQIKRWIHIESLKVAFMNLVIEHVPSTKYPVIQQSDFDFRSTQDQYQYMLTRIGEDEKTGRNSRFWWFELGKRLLQSQNQSISYKILKYVVLSPLIVFYILSAIPALIFLPFRYILIKLRIYNKFRSFTDSINFVRWTKFKRAKYLLEAAQKAHIIQIKDNSILFTHKCWVDYFAAQYVVWRGKKISDLLYGNQTEVGYWKRCDPKRDGIAINICGIVENPYTFIQELIPVDSLLAKKCILSGIEKAPDDVTEKITQNLRAIISDVRNAGEQRSYDFAKEFLELQQDPSDVSIILDAIREIEPVRQVNLPLAKLIADTYGSNVVEILLRRLKTAEKELFYVILILGWIGDKRAIEPLKNLQNLGEYLQALNLVVLATCFKEKSAIKELLEYLFFLRGDESGKDTWHKLPIIGEDAVLWSMDILINQVDAGTQKWWNAAGMCLRICGVFSGSQKIGSFLLDNLPLSKNKDVEKFILLAIGNIKYQDGVEYLLEKLTSVDDKIRLRAIESLGKIKERRAVQPLIGLLYSKNIHIVREVIIALKEIKSPDSINALTQKLYDDDAIQEDELLRLEPCMPMIIIDTLIEINTPKALQETTKWCKKQLGNKRQGKYGFYKYLSDAALFYLEFKIDTNEASEIAQNWKVSQSSDAN